MYLGDAVCLSIKKSLFSLLNYGFHVIRMIVFSEKNCFLSKSRPFRKEWLLFHLTLPVSNLRKVRIVFNKNYFLNLSLTTVPLHFALWLLHLTINYTWNPCAAGCVSSSRGQGLQLRSRTVIHMGSIGFHWLSLPDQCPPCLTVLLLMKNGNGSYYRLSPLLPLWLGGYH